MCSIMVFNQNPQVNKANTRSNTLIQIRINIDQGKGVFLKNNMSYKYFTRLSRKNFMQKADNHLLCVQGLRAGLRKNTALGC